MLYQENVGTCDETIMTTSIDGLSSDNTVSDVKTSCRLDDDDVDESDLLNAKLDMLRQRVGELRSTWENGYTDIHSYCSMLRNRVDLRTELAIQELQDASEELRARIKQHELDCLESFEAAYESREWLERVHKYEKLLYQTPLFCASNLKSSLRTANQLLAKINSDLDEAELIKHNKKRLVFSGVETVALGALNYQGKFIYSINLIDFYIIQFKAIKKSRVVVVAVSRHIKTWDLETGELLQSLSEHSDEINSLASSGNTIVSASADRTIKVWDIVTGRCLNTLTGHTDEVKKILIIDETQVASASKDRSIKLWNMTNSTCLNTLLGHKHTVTTLSYLKSKNQLLSGSIDSSIRIWDIKSGECIRVMNTGFNSHVYSLVRLNDETVVSCGLNNLVKCWNMKMGILENEIRDNNLDQSHYLTAVCLLNEDEHRIAVGSSDGWIKAWCLRTDQCEIEFKAHDEQVTSLAVFETDDNVLVSSSSDGTVKYWDLDTGDCLKELFVNDRLLRAVLGLELDIDSMNKN